MRFVAYRPANGFQPEVIEPHQSLIGPDRSNTKINPPAKSLVASSQPCLHITQRGQDVRTLHTQAADHGIATLGCLAVSGQRTNAFTIRFEGCAGFGRSRDGPLGRSEPQPAWFAAAWRNAGHDAESTNHPAGATGNKSR